MQICVLVYDHITLNVPNLMRYVSSPQGGTGAPISGHRYPEPTGKKFSSCWEDQKHHLTMPEKTQLWLTAHTHPRSYPLRLPRFYVVISYSSNEMFHSDSDSLLPATDQSQTC